MKPFEKSKFESLTRTWYLPDAVVAAVRTQASAL